MIYTLTLSPSSDLLIKSEEFSLEKVNRYQNYQLLPGGKGINASIILKRHNFDNIAFSLFDLNTFNNFQEFFNKENLKIENINHPELTRINIKYYGNLNSFELNGPKTKLTNEIKQAILTKLSRLNKNDLVMIMGLSDESFLTEILTILFKNNTQFLLDIDSANLKDFLAFKPFLIKPNFDELTRNFNLTIHSEKDLIKAMENLQSLGAQNIIVSMDKDGAYLLTDKKQIFKATVLKPIEVVSATGAGDSMISLFSAKYLETNDPKLAFSFASAGAMGTVNSFHVGNLEKTNKHLSNVKIKQIK